MKHLFLRLAASATLLLSAYIGDAQSFKVFPLNRAIFRYYPVALLDPGYQRAKGAIGWEHHNWTTMLGGAYGLGAQSPIGFGAKKIDQKFWEAAISLKYQYTDDLRKHKGSHLEMELSYFNERFFRTNDWYYDQGHYQQYGGAFVSKKAIRVGLYAGRERHFGRKFSINYQIGLSVRANELRHLAFEPARIEAPLIGGIMKRFDRKEGWSVNVVPVVRIAFDIRPLRQLIKSKKA